VVIGKMPKDLNALFGELADGHVADAVMSLGAKRAYSIATQLLMRVGLSLEWRDD